MPRADCTMNSTSLPDSLRSDSTTGQRFASHCPALLTFAALRSEKIVDRFDVEQKGQVDRFEVEQKEVAMSLDPNGNDDGIGSRKEETAIISAIQNTR